MSKQLKRCAPLINGSAYCGMLRENDHGSFGPDFVGPGPYYVAEEVDALIERLQMQLSIARDAQEGSWLPYVQAVAECQRLRAALEKARQYLTDARDAIGSFETRQTDEWCAELDAWLLGLSGIATRDCAALRTDNERLRAALGRARELIRRGITEGYNRHEFNVFLSADENALSGDSPAAETSIEPNTTATQPKALGAKEVERFTPPYTADNGDSKSVAAADRSQAPGKPYFPDNETLKRQIASDPDDDPSVP